MKRHVRLVADDPAVVRARRDVDRRSSSRRACASCGPTESARRWPTSPRRPRPARADPPRPSAIAFPPYASWSDLLFRLADGVTLLVTVGKTSVRLSYIDLGLAHGNTREPTRGWVILRTICEGHGKWDWRAFGDKDTVPQLVSELQKTLMAAFDLTEKPFGRLTRSKGYAPKFHASPGPGRG